MKKILFNRRGFIAVSCIALLTIFVAVILFRQNNGTYVKYKEFNDQLIEGKITNVTIYTKKIEFHKEADNELYYTDNPKTSDFKERLLLLGIEVKDNTEGEDGFDAFLSIFFDVAFIAIILIVIYKIFGESFKSFKVIKHTGVKFEDIAGLDDLKKEIMYAVDMLKNPEKYKRKGVRPTKGIVLEGPPGNGKTLFAKALAEEAGVNFIATKGADFQSVFMSIGPRKIKQLFHKARRHKPCIIFIDEFDSIGERRNYAGSGIDKENNRMITAMLNEMDGFENEDGVLVIAATNSYASLDEALVRPGRFDLKYTIPNPDQATRVKLINLYTREKRLSDDIRIENLAGSFNGLSCSAIETVLNEAAVVMISEGKSEIDMNCIIKACRKMGIRIMNS
ncbi:MAG TPA: AAA family ATPase [Clostridiaceae bacterium]|nr:AAA family ATPase [Clostridiaceae bacterium]